MHLFNSTYYNNGRLREILNDIFMEVRSQITRKQLLRISWKKLDLYIKYKRRNSKRNSIGSDSIKILQETPLSEYEFAYLVSGLIRWRAGLKNPWKKEEYLSKYSQHVIVPKLDFKKKTTPQITDSPVAVQNLSFKDFAERMRAKRHGQKDDNASNTR